MADEQVTRFETAGGARIYRIPLKVFPSMWGYAHLVLADDYAALVDVGSGQGQSDSHLRAGLEDVATRFGERVSWTALNRVVITHAHIDHHGGLNAVRELTQAPVAIHELDRRVIVNYRERLALSRFRLAVFLRRAGAGPEVQARLLAMYASSKDLVRPEPVETVLKDGDLLDGRFVVHHVPGHCPGQVCLQLDDVLLTADHVLPGVALFLAPESLTASTGVDHYLQSLAKIAKLSGIRLCLGGHGEPVKDLQAAVAGIAAGQHQRIERIYAACTEPRSLAELTADLYPKLADYDELLALQKVGAYVEYLDQRGMLAVANLDEVAEQEDAVPRYRAV